MFLFWVFQSWVVPEIGLSKVYYSATFSLADAVTTCLSLVMFETLAFTNVQKQGTLWMVPDKGVPEIGL